MHDDIITFSEFWFPQQVIVSKDLKFSKVKKKLIDFCYSEKNKDKEGRNLSNCRGWQSNLINPEEKYIWVYEYLMTVIKPAIYQQLNLIDDTNFSIENFWINISNKHSYNDYHFHSGCDYSGCLYIQYEHDCGTIQFNPNLTNNTDWMNFLKEDYKSQIKIYPSVEFNPQEGMVLLFPAHLMHKVNSNLKEINRISISFNIKFFKNL